MAKAKYIANHRISGIVQNGVELSTLHPKRVYLLEDEVAWPLLESGALSVFDKGEIDRDKLQETGGETPTATPIPVDFPAYSLLTSGVPGYKFVEQLTSASDDELLSVSGIGSATVRAIREELKRLGQ